MRTIRTLLSGGELFGVGARAAGYAHIDGYEIDPKIAAVARANGFDVRAADIGDIDYESLPPADHLHASPVCTRASQANVGAEEADADRAMAGAICCAIRAHTGPTFTLENVWAYRSFESFARILAALHAAGFVSDVAHVNAADYGVPQTRKRLILRAVRGPGRVPPLHPTHRKGGDMFYPPWVGWYAAIEDIIHTLPETQPAPWQLARMPKELRESTLFPSRMSHDHDGNCYGPQSRAAGEPSLTLSTMTPGWYRAFLIGAGGWDGNLVQADEDTPAFTMTATDNSQQIRAFLMGDQRAGSSDSVQVRTDDEPALTVRSLGVSGGSAPRAYLIHGQNARTPERGGLSIQAENEPVFTVNASGKGIPRACAGGRWVRMTIQALGRFQTVPDSYIGLTAQINGNGIPCLLARRIMESLRGVYAN